MRTLKTVALLAATLAIAPACRQTTTTTSGEDEVVNPAALYDAGLESLARAQDNNRERDWQAALELFEQAATAATEQGAPHAKANYNAARIHARFARSAEAERFYQGAIAADPGYLDAVLNLAYLYIASDRAAAAVDIYRGYLEQTPDDIAVKNSLAAALGEAGAFDEGVQVVQEILFDDAENLGAYKALARIYFAGGDTGMGGLASGNALRLDESDSDIKNNLGLSELARGNEAAAINFFQEALDIDATNLQANMNLGLIALRSNDWQRAAGCFQAVLEQEPRNTDALIGMAVAYRGNLDFDAAVEHYDMVLEVDATNRMALLNKAQVLFRYQAAYDASLRVYRAFSQAYPDEDIQALVDAVTERKRQKEEEERMLAEMERMMAEQERLGQEAAERAAVKLQRAVMIFERFNEAVPDPSFNDQLIGQIQGLEMAIESLAADFIAEAELYLDEALLDPEYGYLTNVGAAASLYTAEGGPGIEDANLDSAAPPSSEEPPAGDETVGAEGADEGAEEGEVAPEEAPESTEAAPTEPTEETAE